MQSTVDIVFFNDKKVKSNGVLLTAIRALIKENKGFKCGQFLVEKGTPENPAWIHISLPFMKNGKMIVNVEGRIA